MSSAPADAPPRALSVFAHNGRLPADTLQSHKEEQSELARAARLDVLATHTVRVARPDPAAYIRAGVIAHIQNIIAQYRLTHIVFNQDLTVTQSRNLAAALACHIIDRTELILNIFSRRAKSYEGRLQVELALCRHQLGRLSGQWTHLERQRGGARMRGGPGEKQIEIDRRLLRVKIARLEKQIAKLESRRSLSRWRRQKNRMMSVALAGYTNAGKSSLFNQLCRAEAVSARDQLFETLDSTARRVHVRDDRFYILSDTVGFIRDLPHGLIAGFRATLQETADSDILLVVADISQNDWQERLDWTLRLLDDIGARPTQTIIAHNKIDKAGLSPRHEALERGARHHLYLSCRTGAGVPLLRRVLEDCLDQHHA